MTDDQKTDFLAKLMIGKKYGGTLRLWFLAGGGVCGCLVGSTDKRHPDGKPIQTSKMIKIHDINNEQILETMNSYYRLIERSSMSLFSDDDT
jgi:hypothetical protein